VCTDISGHDCQLESGSIHTLEARRECVAIEGGHVVWQCVLPGMDNLVQTGTGHSVSRFKNLWHFTSRSYTIMMIQGYGSFTLLAPVQSAGSLSLRGAEED